MTREVSYLIRSKAWPFLYCMMSLYMSFMEHLVRLEIIMIFNTPLAALQFNKLVSCDANQAQLDKIFHR